MYTNVFQTRWPSVAVAALGGVAAGVLAATPALVWLAARAAAARDRAARDPLTAIANRRTARTRFTRTRRKQDLLLLDLNGFKDINDSQGHSAGDMVIQQVAARLHEWARDNGAFVARLGGDEFVVLKRHSSPANAWVTARRLRHLAALTTFFPHGHELTPVHTSASVGVALPRHGRTWAQRLRAADLALYHAKHSRRRIAVYTPGMTMPSTQPGARLRDQPGHGGDGHD